MHAGVRKHAHGIRLSHPGGNQYTASQSKSFDMCLAHPGYNANSLRILHFSLPQYRMSKALLKDAMVRFHGRNARIEQRIDMASCWADT